MVKYINEPRMFVVEIMLAVSRIILQQTVHLKLRTVQRSTLSCSLPTPNILKDM